MITHEEADNPSSNLLKEIRKELSINKAPLESDQSDECMKEYEAI